MQLTAKAVTRGGCGGSAAERLQLAYLRQLLGVQQATPNTVVLAETGQQPLWLRWLRRAAKLWNRVVAEQPGSLVRQALTASIQLAASDSQPLADRQSWAAQLAATLTAIDAPINLAAPAPIDLTTLQSAGLVHQAHRLAAAAQREGASRLQHYVHGVRGGQVPPSSLEQRQPYLDQVRQRHRRQPLAQAPTGALRTQGGVRACPESSALVGTVAAVR